MTRIAILDYGMGNLRSVEKALEHVGVDAEVTHDHERARGADGVILPGVGAFPKAMERIRERGLDELIAERVSSAVPVLGICLGLQPVFESSDEREGAAGLGLVDGPVSGLRADGLKVRTSAGRRSPGRRVPAHGGPRPGGAFYFVHSFAPRPATPDDVLGTRGRGERFVAPSSAATSSAPSSTRRSRAARDCACCAISPRSVLLCLHNRRRPLPSCRTRTPAGPTSNDPLSRDRHPRGRAVRLLQGDYDRETAYDADPVDAARRWAAGGAGGFTSSTSTAPRTGTAANLDHVRRIARAVDPPLQLGGGLRDADAVERALGAGAERVVIGTAALRDPGFLDAMLDRHGQRVVVGVDARSGMAATEGWVETSDEPAPALIRALAERGASRIVLTPIEVDGTMEDRGSPSCARSRPIWTPSCLPLGQRGASTTCGRSRPSSCRRSVARSSAGRSTKGDSASRRRSRRCAGRANLATSRWPPPSRSSPPRRGSRGRRCCWSRSSST